MNTFISLQIGPLVPKPVQTLIPPLPTKPSNVYRSLITHRNLTVISIQASKRTKTQQSNQHNGENKAWIDDGIPADETKTLAKFKSRHNYIRVIDVSRRADHPLAGSRLLLLDNPGNIHSISFLFKTLTSTYFDVFAALPPILPPGPIAILGFGAGSAARLILHLHPNTIIHGWELDPSVISVGREFFGLSKLEKQNPGKLFVYVGDAMDAEIRDGFSGILVDLFAKGSLIPELQDPRTWEKMKGRLRRGGRIMVNCGGNCVESEDPKRNGDLVMKETMKAMGRVFAAHELFVLNLWGRNEDSCVAMTGPLPDREAWKEALPKALRRYVDMWAPLRFEG